MKRAVFPGSFDPVTIGHLDIIKKGITLFDEIIVAIGVNADKKYMWPLSQRKVFLEEAFKDYPQVKVSTYKGLTAKFCKEVQATFILRGLRNSLDFSYEKSIAQTNFEMAGIESIFLVCNPSVAHISSTIVRDIARNDGDYSKLVPFRV